MLKKALGLWLGAALLYGCAPETDVRPPVEKIELPDGVKPLGKMDGFYRYTAVLGPSLESGYQVMEMPAWMQETDFPYQKRPYEKEIPFADGLSVVRLLGAGKTAEDAHKPGGTADLVLRDGSGQLHYRWDLLKARLDPYILLGYSDLTLVMDNLPWCFPETPVVGEYGQKGPPSDYREWYAFMKALCAELKRLYGEETVRNFRFRMGTEMQDERRWIGGFEGYLHYYDLAAKAVHEEIPGAGFGPFNRSMPVAREGQSVAEAEKVSIVELARHCADTGTPFDFLARSFYYFSSRAPSGSFGNIHPGQRLPEIEKLWDDVEQIVGPVSREVHEFGPHLSTEEGLYGMDTGARGAAQSFETVVQFLEAGADRLWHWQLFEKVEGEKQLLYSLGWLYAVLDHLRGGEAYILPVVAAEDHGNSHKALLSVLGDRTVLVVSCWNVDRVKQEPDRLALQIPAALLPRNGQAVRSLAFTEQNSLYDVLRRDVAAAGLLSEKHKNHRGSPAASALENGYDGMVADRTAGRRLIAGNWATYEGLMRDSLRLSPFEGSVQSGAGNTTIEFTAACPSVTVLVWE